MPVLLGLYPTPGLSAPVFDPATLPLATWYRDYTGTGYAGTASADSSGTRPGTVSISPTPTAGALSGKATSVWTYGSGSNITTSTASSALFPNPTTAGFSSILFNATNALGTTYQTGAGIWGDTQNYGANIYMGMAMSATGPCFTLYSYGNSAYNTLIYTGVGTTNVWMAVFVYWDGTNVYMSVNNGAPISTACPSSTTSPSTNIVALGRGYASAGTSFGGSIADWMTSRSNLSSSISNIYSYYKVRYPGAGLP